jgi:iron(III) transport system permease protein
MICKPSLDEAASILGKTSKETLIKIHLPLLQKGLLTAMLLSLVDVLKEMPITLMTRPFGWDTLAVKIYELTSEGEWDTQPSKMCSYGKMNFRQTCFY